MANARRDGGALCPDYRQALTNIDMALKEKPDDAEALALKLKYEAAWQEIEKSATESRQRELVEAQPQVPAEHFQNATKSYADVDLFDTYHLELKSTLQITKAAVLRAVRKTSTKWSTNSEEKPDQNTSIFHFTPSGLLTLGRHCSILVSEVVPGEVHVYSKFWDYVGSSAGNSIIDVIIPDKFVAVHKKFFKPEQAAAIDQRRKEIADNFYKALQNELR